MRLYDFFLDILFPKKCVCGRWDTVLCAECYKKINFKKSQVCPICRKLTDNGKTCISCRNRSALTGVMIFGEHEGILKKLIWVYKYEFVKDLSEPLAEIMTHKFGSFIKSKNPIITYVPINKKRYNWRGFNQSRLLAEKVALKLSLDFEPLLTRAGKSKPQVGLKRTERMKNLKGQIKPVEVEVTNKKIIIVDDVFTSGATLEECARVLRERGFREVWGLVLSRD